MKIKRKDQQRKLEGWLERGKTQTVQVWVTVAQRRAFKERVVSGVDCQRFMSLSLLDKDPE